MTLDTEAGDGTLPGPPASEAELFQRADALAGRSLAWVAARAAIAVPADPVRAKGWIGTLLERVLGASAGSKAEPDFPALGVELKTLPVDERGRPRESTYVCTAPLDGSLEARWADAWVRRKLSRVLWVPVVGRGAIGERRVGAPLLWSPDDEEEALLRADWEELSALIAEGELWQLDARRGRALQLRPKAATGADLAWTVDTDGEWVRQNPRGFYLRASFTAALLSRAFVLPG